MGLLDARAILIERGSFTLGPIDVSLLEGKGTAIAGRNGSGKTTLLEGLSGVLPLRDGSISLIDEENVYRGKWDGKRYAAVAQNIGIQLQDVHLFELLSIEEHIQFFADIYGVNTERYMTLVRSCPALSGQEKARYKTLSSGKKQLLQIILAIGHSPKLVFLDEPTSGIDDDNKEWLWHTLTEIKEQGGGLIFSSHEGREMDALGEYLIVLDKGQPVLFSSKENAEKALGYSTVITIIPPTTLEGDAHSTLSSIEGVVHTNNNGKGWTIRSTKTINEIQKNIELLGNDWNIAEIRRVGLHDIYQNFREASE